MDFDFGFYSQSGWEAGVTNRLEHLLQAKCYKGLFAVLVGIFIR